MSYRIHKLDDGEGPDNGPRYEIDDPHGFTICVVDDEDTARLFAAAPKLLTALETQTEAAQAIIAAWSQGDLAGAVRLLDASLADALAAIAKAKGGAA